MYDAIEDPYTYKNSTVLVNKLDLQNQADLDAFEAEISSARAEEPLPGGSMDFENYKAIHHHLFQDVYHWAGQIRTVRIAKGGNPFCFPENIESQATRLFDNLRLADAAGRVLAAFSGTTTVEGRLPWPRFASGLRPSYGIFQHECFEDGCLAGRFRTLFCRNKIR
jgi:fido (protein-threonine AMPylation protein)